MGFEVSTEPKAPSPKDNPGGTDSTRSHVDNINHTNGAGNQASKSPSNSGSSQKIVEKVLEEGLAPKVDAKVAKMVEDWRNEVKKREAWSPDDRKKSEEQDMQTDWLANDAEIWKDS